MKRDACYLCGAANTEEFFSLPPLPTQDGIMCASEAAADAVPRGSIQLRFCAQCGYIGNEGHEQNKVRFDEYDFSNHQSSIYTTYTRELSASLIERYELRGKTVVEIGCGDGDFLREICRQGNNRGIGIDPGFDHTGEAGVNGSEVSFLRDYYGAQHGDLEADLVASRHLISLPNDPQAFINLLRQNLQDKDAVVYLETPNVRHTLGENNIWNVVYEHRSWFSEESLRYMLELGGFDVLSSDLCWNGAYLNLEARPRQGAARANLPDPGKLEDLALIVRRVAAEIQAFLDLHRQQVAAIRSAAPRAVGWGSGAAAVNYFNLFDLKQQVPFIVDINAKRQGKYLPGSGQQIVAPDFLKSYQPELIIITNPTYEAEIRGQVHALGLAPEFRTL